MRKIEDIKREMRVHLDEMAGLMNEAKHQGVSTRFALKEENGISAVAELRLFKETEV